MTAVVSTVAVVTHDDAWAGGYGIYLEGEISDAWVDDYIPFANSGRKVIRDFRSGMGGLGFVYDTNIARDEPINYRFKIGYRYGQRKWDKTDTITVPRNLDKPNAFAQVITFEPKSRSAQGLTLNQTLGYGFVRNQAYRVWAGPTVRLNIDWYGVATDLDIVDVAFGGGPEIGINYHLGDNLSVGASVSYNFLYLGEHFETTGDDQRFDGYQHLLALSISVFFRSEFDRFGD